MAITMANKVMVDSKKEVENLRSAQLPNWLPAKMTRPIWKPIPETFANTFKAVFAFCWGFEGLGSLGIFNMEKAFWIC